MLLILFATVFFTTVYGQTNNDQCPYDPVSFFIFFLKKSYVVFGACCEHEI